MGLIGDNCKSCQDAANDPDGGGLAGAWWRGWAKVRKTTQVNFRTLSLLPQYTSSICRLMTILGSLELLLLAGSLLFW